MSHWYGPLRLEPSAPTVLRHPTVSPLPLFDAPSPRRRRTITCSNLTINGQPWTVEDAREFMKDVLKGDKADIRCSQRAGVTLSSAFAIDRCLSSWCRQCEWVLETAA